MPSRSVSQSLNALPPGTVLRDHVIESELGSGGFSIVYLARHHLKSDWLYAIKEHLPAELAARARDGTGVRPLNTVARSAFEDGLRRFRDEAEQLRKFRNERYIVSCLNYFEENNTAYLVMDYDDGLPLSEFLRLREAAGQPFTEADLLAVVEPLLEGLAVVHLAGVLHRDIKPGNIFVRRQDDITGRPAHPVLIDFGAAKQNYLERHSRSRAPYTPGYAAFEQVSSMGDIGPWTDVYALGALMWRMVAGGCPGDSKLLVSDKSTGEPVWSPTPRAAEKRGYALHRGKADPMIPAAELGASRYSPRLLKTIDHCLSLYPDDRTQSCEELLSLLNTLRTSAPPLSKQYLNSPAARPRRANDLPATKNGDASDSPNERASDEGGTRSARQNGLASPLLTGRHFAYWSCAAVLLASIVWYIQYGQQSQLSTPNRSDVTLENVESVPDNEAEVADVLFALGVMDYEGDGGPEDKARAADMFTRAAEQGHARSQSMLGYMYYGGEGVPQNYAQALQWYTHAAEQGIPDAQMNLGRMYANGEGVPLDNGQAYAWASLASVDGQPNAVALRNEIARSLSETQLAEAQQLSLELYARIQNSL